MTPKIKVGDQILDNDPRHNLGPGVAREGVVVETETPSSTRTVQIRVKWCTGRSTWIDQARIRNDDPSKPTPRRDYTWRPSCVLSVTSGTAG